MHQSRRRPIKDQNGDTMTKIALDSSKLLGFRLGAASTGSKIGDKGGQQAPGSYAAASPLMGAKVGDKGNAGPSLRISATIGPKIGSKVPD